MAWEAAAMLILFGYPVKKYPKTPRFPPSKAGESAWPISKQNQL
jgi:hypothetical protein